MPYVRFWISDDERASLLRMARRQEAEAARLDKRQPRRVTASGAAQDCYAEGYEDMRQRQVLEGDDEDE